MEFSLIRLPDVPKIQIIQFMTIGERIKLALSSRRMENYLSLLFKKPADLDYIVKLRGEISYIGIDDNSWKLFMRPLRPGYKKPNYITDDDLEPCMKDLNTFIKYWINCDENMFTYLNIEYKHFNVSKLMKDITVLKGFRSKEAFYLIASNSTEKQLLMTIRLVEYSEEPQTENELDFSIQDANEPHKFMEGGTVPAWTREYRILGRLARKRSLAGKKVTVEEAKELDDLEKELAAEGVRMINGIMTVKEKL
uniref:F-box domain-containing protein n=1 Tax=Caenorhabditis tropicalis TaxID=1561998 RepID=A0A1I7UC70_9PELO